jgi:hypothetical protein
MRHSASFPPVRGANGMTSAAAPSGPGMAAKLGELKVAPTSQKPHATGSLPVHWERARRPPQSSTARLGMSRCGSLSPRGNRPLRRMPDGRGGGLEFAATSVPNWSAAGFADRSFAYPPPPPLGTPPGPILYCRGSRGSKVAATRHAQSGVNVCGSTPSGDAARRRPRSKPPRRGAGNRAQRFLAATLEPVIRTSQNDHGRCALDEARADHLLVAARAFGYELRLISRVAERAPRRAVSSLG